MDLAITMTLKPASEPNSLQGMGMPGFKQQQQLLMRQECNGI